MTADLGSQISLLWTLPFAGLLLSIAFLPLAAPKFWESNRNKAVIAALFGVPTALYIGGMDIHELSHVGMEYFSFIVLLAALFVISGGIHLEGDIEATPSANVLFLLTGAVLANFIGTTGASMLLIRPILNTNKERRNTAHIPVFFIFLVSNIGGALLPLGDPPLFLGYLEGVPFFWTLKLFPIWMFTLGLLLTVFYAIDRWAYSRESQEAIRRDMSNIQPLKLKGGMNFVWLLGVLLATIFAPAPWRELILLLMISLSWSCTPHEIRKKNAFSFGPMVEVAVLFAGIFSAMIPCLLILKARGGSMGITKPWQFFWASGGLSSFLDNAPTYLTYLSLGQGVTHSMNLPQDVIVRGGGIWETYLKAVSVGSVFMGANTYIGNAPNFMVKAISDERRFKTPSFPAYMLWSGTILIPAFLLVTLIFF